MLKLSVVKSRILLGTLLVAAGAVGLLVSSRTTAQATVSLGDVRQTIDGFGGSSADFLAPLSAAQADLFFTQSGIGLTILRTQIIPDRAACDAEFQKGGCNSANSQTLDGELRSAQLAVAREAIVIASPWSPPGSFKTNGSFNNGGALLAAHYSDWAREIAEYVVMMAHNGVPIYAVSVQNEPDLSTGYGSCLYTPQQIHDFVPFLHSALQSAGVGSTKIAIAEESSWSFDLTAVALSDTKVAPDVAIIAAHAYSGDMRPFAAGDRHLWQTEVCNRKTVYDGSMADGVLWARTMHSCLSGANVNA